MKTRDWSKPFLVAAGFLFLTVYPLWFAVMNPKSAIAGVIQAIIPAAVPTAFRQGSTGTKFLISNGAFSTNDCVQIDGNGNASSAGGACGIAGGGAAFNAITSGTNTTATMVVGTSASLSYTATGTINASALQGKTGLQGNGSNVQLAGTVASGAARGLCTDANGNTTTTGCSCTTNFSLTGGTVNNLFTSGCITGVTRNSTGLFTLTLSSPPTNYSIICTAGANGVQFVGCSNETSTTPPFGSSSIQFSTWNPNSGGGAFVDAKVVSIIITPPGTP